MAVNDVYRAEMSWPPVLSVDGTPFPFCLAPEVGTEIGCGCPALSLHFQASGMSCRPLTRGT